MYATLKITNSSVPNDQMYRSPTIYPLIDFNLNEP